MGEEFTVNIALNTENALVDGLDVFVEAVNLEIKNASKVDLPSNLFFIKDPKVVGDRVVFSILANSEDRFENNEAQSLVSLTLSGRAYCADTLLIFNEDFSVVASQGKNILGSPKDASFNIKSPEGMENPEFTSPSSVFAQVDQPFSYTAAASNPNDGTLVYTYSNLPDWLVADGATINGTPIVTGTFTIGVIVEDKKGGSACLTLTVSTVNQQPIEISSVEVETVSYNSATVIWETNRLSTSQVEYGTTADYGDETGRDETLVTSHSVVLGGLNAKTEYHFRVKSTAPDAPNEAVSGDYTLTTTVKPARVLNLKLHMEGKPGNKNGYPVMIFARGTPWRVVFTPHSNGSYPLPLDDFPEETADGVDFLLKGYQHLQVKRTVEIKREEFSFPADFGILPAGDIGPVGNPDNYVNVMDYSVLVSEWNLESARESIGDFNADLFVNSLDYSIMVNNFNRSGDI